MDSVDDIFGRQVCLSLGKGEYRGQEDERLELHDGGLLG